MNSHIKHVALATLLAGSVVLAEPRFIVEERDLPTADNATAFPTNGTKTTLTPIIPPSVNPFTLSNLALGNNITLAWAGSPDAVPYAGNGTARRLLKRDGGYQAQAAFQFAYPAVPLDHSSYITNVSCSGSTLSAALSPAAFDFAQNEWSNASNIVFISSADGCGKDNVNDMFLASSISFNQDEQTFTATGGSAANVSQVANRMQLSYGELGTSNPKRAIDKRHMFEPHHLDRRLSANETLFTLDFSGYLDDILGIDQESPWPHSSLLATFSDSVGIPDSAWREGENENDGAGNHHKRRRLLAREEEGGESEGEGEQSTENSGESGEIPDKEGESEGKGEHEGKTEEEEEEEEIEFGINIYCVSCGFDGSITPWGYLDFSFDPFDFGIKDAQVGFGMELYTSVGLGIEAFVKWEKTYDKTLAYIPLEPSLDIPDLLYIGPYFSIDFQIQFEIKASGSLMLGTGVTWPGIDLAIDLLDPFNSYVHGFENKIYTPYTDAQGEVDISLQLALPLTLGVGLTIFDPLTGNEIWGAGAGFVDTPAIVAEGKFEIEAEIGEDINGTVSSSVDINGGCYGIAWEVFFENALNFTAYADDIAYYTHEIIPAYVSPPIASGCIGYVDSDPDSDDDPANDGNYEGMNPPEDGAEGEGEGPGEAGESEGEGSAKGGSEEGGEEQHGPETEGKGGKGSNNGGHGSNNGGHGGGGHHGVKGFVLLNETDSSSYYSYSSWSSYSSYSSFEATNTPNVAATTTAATTTSPIINTTGTTANATTIAATPTTTPSAGTTVQTIVTTVVTTGTTVVSPPNQGGTTNTTSTSTPSTTKAAPTTLAPGTTAVNTTTAVVSPTTKPVITTTVNATTAVVSPTTKPVTTTTSPLKPTTTPTTSPTTKPTTTTAVTPTTKPNTTTAATPTTKATTTSTKPITTVTKATTTSTKPITTSTKVTTTKATSPTTKATSTTAKATTPTTKATTPTTKATSTTAKAVTPTTKIACTPTATANAQVTKTATCSDTVKQAFVKSAYYLVPAMAATNTSQCAGDCLKNSTCLSFSYNTKASSCQLYNQAVKNMTITTQANAPQLTFFDRGCYANSTC